MDVTGRARAATAAQGEQFVEATVANDLHQRSALGGIDAAFLTFMVDDGNLRHSSLSLLIHNISVDLPGLLMVATGFGKAKSQWD
jgi:hypothetical protein